MKRYCSIPVTLSLVVLSLASLGCGAGYGTGNVYVGVGGGPYVGHPYPYGGYGGYGGWVGRPYPAPYYRFEDAAPSEQDRGQGPEAVPSDSVSAIESGQSTYLSTANQGTRSTGN